MTEFWSDIGGQLCVVTRIEGNFFHMLAGIRTQNLRKVYTSAPPAAAGAGGFVTAASRGKGKQPKAQVVALDGISLNVAPGELFCLLGPNGAGKSTTASILTTRVRPTAGQAWIGDLDVWKNQVAVKRLIGVVAQRPNLDFSLTAREILLFHGAYFGIDSHERGKRASALLDRFKLTDRADQMVRGFSGGMMQRLSIARAMMHDPQVLFLDEPSTGLDPQTRLLLWEIVRDYNKSGKTILLTTHNMEEADALCQRLAIIDHGRVIALGTPRELKASVPGGYLLRLRFGHSSDDLLARLKSLSGVTEVRATENHGVDLYADRGGSLVPEVANTALSAEVALCDVHISEPSLENLFLHHTGRSLRD
jgi:ABC-2 type transport system ATP-binding protein